MDIDNRMVVVTSTYYPTDGSNDVLRSGLAIEFCRKAIEQGYAIVVCDGGSRAEFLMALRETGTHLLMQKSKGMGGARREAIEFGMRMGAEILVYSEPEKVDFVRQIEKVVDQIRNEDFAMVVPMRKSMESYPEFQKHSEKFMNQYLYKVTGLEVDFTFGPRAWRSEYSDAFLNYDGRYGDLWDAINVPLLEIALNRKKKVKSIEVDFTYPVEQSRYEANELLFYKKRLFQINQVIEGVERYMKETGVARLVD